MISANRYGSYLGVSITKGLTVNWGQKKKKRKKNQGANADQSGWGLRNTWEN